MQPSREEVRRRIAELGPWFHNMNIAGVQTAPDHYLGDYPNVKWRRFCTAIPDDLRGCTVLDIGCNAGFYAIEMKRRGADLVVAIDHDEAYLAQARFAASMLEVDILFRQLSVYDVGVLARKFDIVLFMGVFYHLRYPLLALDLIREHAVSGLLVFQSMQRGSEVGFEAAEDYPFSEQEVFDTPEFPKLHFIEHRYAEDPTNWWVPNRACVEALLRSSGFRVLGRPEPEVYLCEPAEIPFGAGAVYPEMRG